jgi:hypothetical protein
VKVPTYGYEYGNSCFLDDVWALLEKKISKRIREFVYLMFDEEAEKLICQDMKGVGSFYLEWESGKELTLTAEDIEHGKAFIHRTIAIQKEQKVREKIERKYGGILAPILNSRHPDGVWSIVLVIDAGKPAIQVHFDNSMIVYIYQSGCFSYIWERTVKYDIEAKKYIEQFTEKANEADAIIASLIYSIPSIFWNFSETKEVQA